MKRITLKTVALGLLMAACAAPTAITGSWKRQDYKAIRPQKVAVLSLSKDRVHQAVVAEALVKALKAHDIVADRGVDILPEEEFSGTKPSQTQRERLNGKLDSKGYDLIVTAILQDITKDQKYVPGQMSSMPRTYYNSLGDYWFTASDAIYEPGYWVNTSKVVMETNVYELPSGKLVWTGQSQTVDPANLQDFSNSYAPKLVARLFSDGVLK